MLGELKKGQLYKVIQPMGLTVLSPEGTVKTWASDLELLIFGDANRDWVTVEVGDILFLVDFQTHLDRYNFRSIKFLFLTNEKLGTFWSDIATATRFKRIWLKCTKKTK